LNDNNNDDDISELDPGQWNAGLLGLTLQLPDQITIQEVGSY
jgi:hypothetical protein